MRTTPWIGMLVGGVLLVAGCGKAPMNQPAAPAVPPRVEAASPPATLDTVPAAKPVAEPASAPVSVEPADKRAAAEGAKVADKEDKRATEEKTKTEGAETPHPKEKGTGKSGKPSVLGAVGRAVLNSFKSESSQPPPSEAPAFRSQR